MVAPVQNMQHGEQTQPAPFISATNNTLSNAAANNYSPLESSASILFQQGQNIPQILTQVFFKKILHNH